MKIATVVGARPQFIKAAAVSREIAKHPDLVEIIIHTGQHFDKNMSDVFFQEMEIPLPHYHLNINSLDHGAMTGRMLEGIERVLLNEKPDYVMVYGDTNSTLAGALAAKKLHIKVIHVEAGLRSFNMRMPEEINRIITDRISDILCCPTEKAVENLHKEGFENFSCKIIKTGDVMHDAAMYYSQKSAAKSTITQDLGIGKKPFVLCTIHREENTDDITRLSSIIKALNEIARDMEIILPLHPRTAKVLKNHRIITSFKLIPPVSYSSMIELLKHTNLVLTDSGGLQKEAFFFSKPCVTLREQTEWVELVEGGFNLLAGAEKNTILDCYRVMLSKTINFHVDLYGDGQSSQKILSALK